MSNTVREPHVEFHMMEQGSPEWNQIRVGRLTGSKFFNVVDVRNGQFKAAVSRWVSTVAAEEITGHSEESFDGNDATEWGEDNEMMGLQKYGEDNNCQLVRPGFVESDRFPRMGFSPDSYIGRNVSIQMKCPFKTSIFIDAVINGKFSPNYKTQCIYELAVDHELDEVRLVYYDPRIPERAKQVHTVQVFKREDHVDLIKAFQDAFDEINIRVDGTIKQLS